MNQNFSPLTDEQLVQTIEAIYGPSFLSRRDGCRVILARCQHCKCQFEEELESAKGKVRADVKFLCLKCDPDAVALAFTGITVQIGWFS